MNKSVITIPFVITFVYTIIISFERNIVLGEKFVNSMSETITEITGPSISQSTEEKDTNLNECRYSNLLVNDYRLYNLEIHSCKSPCPSSGENYVSTYVLKHILFF